MKQLIRLPADPARADVLRGERSRFAGEVIEKAGAKARPWAAGGHSGSGGPCPIPECDRPLHDGLHEDRDGFRWRQDPREAAEDRTDWEAKQAQP